MLHISLFAHPNAPLALDAAKALATNGDSFTIHTPGIAYSYVAASAPDATATMDVITQTHPFPQKRLIISDMDSTMITVECIDELADFVGKKAHVAAITEKAMRGELDFEAALTERVALLKGLPESTLEECYATRVKMMPGAETLVHTFKTRGGYSVLVSGGFTFFTSRVAKALGFDEDHANRLEVAGGKLTGNVIPPILGKEAKLETLHSTVRKIGISTTEVLAIGDGANDLPMLKTAGLGVAFRAKPKVQAETNARMNVANLDCLQFI